MERQPRLDLPGIPQHVVQRENDRQACSAADTDYLRYLQELGEASSKHDCAIHAYVLMTNHLHLLVTPATTDGISRMMQAVGRRYVGSFNARYRRTGTHWEYDFLSSKPHPGYTKFSTPSAKAKKFGLNQPDPFVVYRVRATALASLGVYRFNQRQQRISRHHLLHLRQKDLPSRLLALAGILGIGKTHLSHRISLRHLGG